MGCSTSKFELDDNLNSSIDSVEKTLPLSRVSLKSLESLILKLNLTPTISSSQILHLCHKLDLSLSSKESLIFHYMKNSNQKELSTSKVLTLLIILGKGSKRKKIRLLFKVYSIWTDDVLVNENIRQMVVNIFEISVEHLLKFSMIYEKTIPDDDLQEYLNKMTYEKNLIIIYFTSLINQSQKTLDYIQFSWAFNRQELNVILKPKLVRMLSYKMSKKSEKSRDSDEETCVTISDFDQVLLKKYSRNISVL